MLNLRPHAKVVQLLKTLGFNEKQDSYFYESNDHLANLKRFRDNHIAPALEKLHVQVPKSKEEIERRKKIDEEAKKALEAKQKQEIDR